MCLWNLELRVARTTFPIGPEASGLQIRRVFAWTRYFPVVLCHDHQNGDHAGTAECQQRGLESGVRAEGKRALQLGQEDD